MTKEELTNVILVRTGIDKKEVLNIIETFMVTIKGKMGSGEEVFLHEFVCFVIKYRAEKKARNISRNTTVIVSSHDISAFKLAKEFMDMVK